MPKQKICIGSGILGGAGQDIATSGLKGRCLVITNSTVNRLYGAHVAGSLEGIDFETVEVPDSESAKSLAQAEKLYSILSERGFDRDSFIIGLGGGVVGDLAGFVASTYLRGIGLIHIPTTLTAQVDSSIGGKAAVNLPVGKNLVGAFHEPKLVISDVSVLRTLPMREFRSGLAEVAKYGMALDSAFFDKLGADYKKILAQNGIAMVETVGHCISLKKNIVRQDPRDTGARQLLNFGHTLGHALEASSGYECGHGEAVALGMVYASKISVKSRLMEQESLEKLEALLNKFGLPARIEWKFDTEEVLRFMASDKKRKGGRLRMVLPLVVGKCELRDDISPKTASETLEEMRA